MKISLKRAIGISHGSVCARMCTHPNNNNNYRLHRLVYWNTDSRLSRSMAILDIARCCWCVSSLLFLIHTFLSTNICFSIRRLKCYGYGLCDSRLLLLSLRCWRNDTIDDECESTNTKRSWQKLRCQCTRHEMTHNYFVCSTTDILSSFMIVTSDGEKPRHLNRN